MRNILIIDENRYHGIIDSLVGMMCYFDYVFVRKDNGSYATIKDRMGGNGDIHTETSFKEYLKKIEIEQENRYFVNDIADMVRKFVESGCGRTHALDEEEFKEIYQTIYKIIKNFT